MSGQFDFAVLQARDANFLHLASRKAVQTVARTRFIGEIQRRELAGAILWVARSGYARSEDGSLDWEALAEAGVARFQALESWAPTILKSVGK